MTQINIVLNKLPRELAEFCFFLIVGFTAGYLGIIWTFYLNNHYLIFLDLLNSTILLEQLIYHQKLIIVTSESY